MTVIAAIPFFRHLVVIADSRVSDENIPGEAGDFLQKLYPIGNVSFGLRVVIGFSGPLEGAYEVLEGVRKKARAYSKPAVAANLLKDIVRWIQFDYQIVKPQNRKRLSFLLAAVEPSRDRSVRKPDWIPFLPTFSTLTLKPSNSEPTKLVVESRNIIKAIGVHNEEFLDELKDRMNKYYDLQFKYPEIGMQVVVNDLILYFMQRQDKYNKVGGLFQCANLSVEGVKWLSYGSIGDIVMKFENGRYIQHNKITGKTIPLMTINEWGKCWPRPKPGSFGLFENPVYRKLVDKKTDQSRDTDIT
jgi:hypothetical protein